MITVKSVVPYYRVNPAKATKILRENSLDLLCWEPENNIPNLTKLDGILCSVQYCVEEDLLPRRRTVALQNTFGNRKGGFKYPERLVFIAFCEKDLYALRALLPSYNVQLAKLRTVTQSSDFPNLVSVLFRPGMTRLDVTFDDGTKHGLMLVTEDIRVRMTYPRRFPTRAELHPDNRVYIEEINRQTHCGMFGFEQGTYVITLGERKYEEPVALLTEKNNSPVVLTTTKKMLHPERFRYWVRKFMFDGIITRCLLVDGTYLQPSDLICTSNKSELPLQLQGYNITHLPLIGYISNGESSRFANGVYLRRSISNRWTLVQLDSNNPRIR